LLAGFLREKRANTSTATAKLARRVLSGFFNYCVDNSELPISPVPSSRALKLNKDSKSVRRAFTLRELKTIFEKCPNDFWKYMVLAGFYCGQRMGDLICLPWAAVDLEHKQVRLTQSKTGKAVVVPLRNELADLIAELRDKAGPVKPADAIWPEQCQRYQKFGAGGFSNEFYDEVLLPAGLVPKRPHTAIKRDGEPTGRRKATSVSFHCLRHTFVSLLKVTGATQATAKELAGHATDAMSDLYTHVPERELNRAIKQLPPIAK
jgi:integrase